MTNLENCFNAAKENEAKFIGVAIRLKNTDKKEIIINPAENFDLKLEYYKQAYDENLNLKGVEGISILGFTYGNDFIDIELDLLGETHGGTSVEEMKQTGAKFDFGVAISLLKEGYTLDLHGKRYALKVDSFGNCENQQTLIAELDENDKVLAYVTLAGHDILSNDWTLA